MARDNNVMPQLVELSGTEAGRVHSLRLGDQIIGRGGGVDIHLDDSDVSRRHARVSVGAEGVRVHDLGSKNGICAQGVPIDGSMLVQHGQILSIGELRLRVNHPASQVSQALADAGEATATTTHTEADPAARFARGLVIPLIGVLLFGALLAAMLAN